MDQTLASKILSTTYTKGQLLRRARLMADFISYRLFTQGISDKSLNDQVESFFSSIKVAVKPEFIAPESAWLIGLGEDFFKSFTPADYNQQIKTLQAGLSGHNSVIIYLPIELPQKEQEEIGRWLKQNISPEILFEVSFDADLIGGCALSYKGVYKDYSIRANVNSNKQAILDSLKGFKHG